MNTDTLEYGIVKYGTPLYVFDLDAMEDTVKNTAPYLGKKQGFVTP